MHGFALNVSPDLTYYSGIIPCGIFDYGVTSIQQILNEVVDVKLIACQVEESFLKKHAPAFEVLKSLI